MLQQQNFFKKKISNMMNVTRSSIIGLLMLEHTITIDFLMTIISSMDKKIPSKLIFLSKKIKILTPTQDG